MTVALGNSFDGGSAGTTISTANSGGSSGDAFSAVTGTPKFSATQRHGASGLSMENAQGASWSPNGASWAFASESRIFVRAYVFLPPAATNNLAVFSLGGLLLTCTTSAMQFNTGGGSVIGPSSVNGLFSGKWFRLEAMTDTAGSATISLRAYASSPESDIPTVASDVTGQAAVAAATGVGIFPSSVFTNGFLNSSAFVDDVAVSTAGWIGPSGAVDRSLHVPGAHDVLASEAAQRAPVARQAQSGIAMGPYLSIPRTRQVASPTGTAQSLSPDLARRAKAGASGGGPSRPVSGQIWPRHRRRG